MNRPRSIIQRPISRQFTTPNVLKQNKLTYIDTLLSRMNPRALAQQPPTGANSAFLKIMSEIITIILHLNAAIHPTNNDLGTLLQTQTKILIQLYNHIAFLSKQKWIPS